MEIAHLSSAQWFFLVTLIGFIVVGFGFTLYYGTKAINLKHRMEMRRIAIEEIKLLRELRKHNALRSSFAQKPLS